MAAGSVTVTAKRNTRVVAWAAGWSWWPRYPVTSSMVSPIAAAAGCRASVRVWPGSTGPPGSCQVSSKSAPGSATSKTASLCSMAVSTPRAVMPSAWLPGTRSWSSVPVTPAAGPVGPSAAAESDLPPLEVAEELVPFGVAGNAVFLAGAGGAAAGDERPVGVDDFFGVDRLVPHRGVDVGVPGHELGDVRGHAVHHRIGDEEPAEILGGEVQRLPAGVSQPGSGQRRLQQLASPVDRHGPALDADLALEQQRHRRGAPPPAGRWGPPPPAPPRPPAGPRG